MKKYRTLIILFLLILLCYPVNNIIHYKSGHLEDILAISVDSFDRVIYSSPDGEYELDKNELGKFLFKFKTMKLKTNIWRYIDFPDEEYIIYNDNFEYGPLFRIKMTDDAVKIFGEYYSSGNRRHVFLIDN